MSRVAAVADQAPPGPAGTRSPDAYLAGRFQSELEYYRRRSASSKRWHVVTQIAVVTATAAVPVTQLLPLDGLVLRLLAAGLGAFAVIVQGVRSTVRFHESWLAYRSMEQFLEQERALFETRVGSYTGLSDEDAFRHFVEVVEQAMRTEQTGFQAVNRQATGSDGAKGQ
jgi:hypothetical protein